MMPTVSTRKRKLSSLDHDSHPAKKGVRAETTPVKRRSPRKHHQSPRKDPRGHLDKENCPSPRKSPRRLADSPSKSLRNSPFKQKVVSSCFYGKQKTIYLTPLERKAIKDSLPSPPPPPPPPPALPSPPSQSKKQQRKTKKTKATGTIKRKASVGSKKPVETGIKSYVTSTKRIKLSKLNSSDTGKPATTTTPAAAAAPTWFPKAMDTKKAITVTFSSMKPRPKIFVGAAFFATGKKPRSIYKKSAPKSCSRPAPASGKSPATAPPPTKSEKTVQQQPALEMNQKQKRDEKPSVQSVRTEENGSSTKQRTKFNPQEWMDLFDDEPPTVEPLSSPKERHVITKKLRVVLTRCPLPTGSSSINSQKESQTEGGSDPVFDLSDISPTSSGSNTSQTSAAMYPIFGSASKRSKKASPQAQVCCSTPNGPIMSMQTPSAAKERSVRRKKDKQDHNQLIIDAGQKQFGAVTCSSCGMVYSIDNPEDTFQHTQFHQRFVDSIKFVGWKKERVVSEFWDGKILLVLPDDPKYAVKKAEEVRQVADSELGFQQVTLSSPSQAKTYLFVNTDRMVVGCLVAEHIRQAYRVLEQQDQHKDMSKEDFMERHRAWCCSTSPEPALCGISRIWVFSLARRQSIATRMLDTVRSTFIFGSHLSKTEIAFSDPTPDGKLFASNYCNTPTFLVYNFIS